MSRIGKLPISIPAGVTVSFDKKTDVITVKGPKGELSQKIDPSIIVENNDGHYYISQLMKIVLLMSKQKQAFHGLYRSLLTIWLLVLVKVIRRRIGTCRCWLPCIKSG
jgi:large subunit ribosomal protein L6